MSIKKRKQQGVLVGVGMSLVIALICSLPLVVTDCYWLGGIVFLVAMGCSLDILFNGTGIDYLDDGDRG